MIDSARPSPEQILEASHEEQNTTIKDDPYDKYVAPVLRMVSQRTEDESAELPRKKIKKRPRSSQLSGANRYRDKSSLLKKYDFANPRFLDDLSAEIQR